MPSFWDLFSDDEETRKRLLTTPPFNPTKAPPFVDPDQPEIGSAEPPPLPAITPSTRPGTLPGPLVTPPVTSMPSPLVRSQQDHFGELNEARDVFLQGTPGRGKAAWLGALRGALQGLGSGQGLGGVIGGAAAGGLLNGINPRIGREQEFDQKVLPRLQERWQSELAQRQQQRQDASDALTNQYRQAQISEINSQNQYRTGELGVAQQNAERQNRLAQSEIDLNSAKAEAARLGKVVTKNIVGDDGKSHSYLVRPDGSLQDLGLSERAMLNQQNVQSRERIANQREAGAQSRFTARQANKTQKKFISESQILQAAQASGGKMSASDVRAKFREQGYTIVR